MLTFHQQTSCNVSQSHSSLTLYMPVPRSTIWNLMPSNTFIFCGPQRLVWYNTTVLLLRRSQFSQHCRTLDLSRLIILFQRTDSWISSCCLLQWKPLSGGFSLNFSSLRENRLQYQKLIVSKRGGNECALCKLPTGMYILQKDWDTTQDVLEQWRVEMW